MLLNTANSMIRKISNTKNDISIQLVREISHLTNSNKWNDIIRVIVTDILESKVGISNSKYFPTSSIEFNDSQEYKAIIRLNIKKDSETILVIWDILHEYGHFLSGKPDSPNTTREIEAWNRAYLTLLKYPELILVEQSFFEYQTNCLKTYYKNTD